MRTGCIEVTSIRPDIKKINYKTRTTTKVKDVCQSLKNEYKKNFTIKEIKEVLTPLNEFEFCKVGRVEFLRKSRIPEAEEEKLKPTLVFDS